jgi:DNA polymerase/3'-5' exonuclease PolX
LTEALPPHVTEIMALEEFEIRHDYIPDFLKSLGKLADLYEKEDDFRATSLRRAIIALEGQIITAVEDIKLFNLGDLRGVGNATLEMFKEFIETGEIQKLEKLRPATSDQRIMFRNNIPSGMTRVPIF